MVHVAARVLQATGAGLMMADEGRALVYVAATDARGRALERAQAEIGEGPCVDCFVYDWVVTTPDVLTDPRWPRLAELMKDEDVRAVLGIPTRLSGVVVGSLDVYQDRPFEWDDSDEEAVQSFNGVVEGTLAHVAAARRESAVARQLQRALDRRVVIERAVGLLMGRDGLTAVRAFDVLRRTARGQRRQVADVARQMLEGL